MTPLRLPQPHRTKEVGREVMRGVDALLTPTIGVLPPRVGQFASLAPPEHFRALAPLGAFTALANVTGQPALSVPFGSVEGIPVGVQLVAHNGHDGELFALARLLEG